MINEKYKVQITNKKEGLTMLEFIFPKDGFFVNSRDGKWHENSLVVPVRVKSDKVPTINGVTATRDGDCFVASVALNGYRNSVVAATDSEQKKISVFAIDKKYDKSYRLSSDDNIRFLKELNEGDYKSIFDHPYLAIYKKAHDLYGAKVHINLFYEFCDKARADFSGEHEYFNLSMMTNRYKDEFIANSDWLKLGFHSRAEYPDKPYKFADRKTVHDDCVAVCREICRFAGKECLSNCTTIHWGEGNREVVRELRALGLEALTGYFKKGADGQPIVSFYVDNNELDNLENRDFWMDTTEDMIFTKVDRVLNYSPLEEILADVEKTMNDLHRGGFVEIMIHEQYFYSDFNHYRPDFEDRVLLPCKMLAENGYTGTLLTEVISERAYSDYPEFL